MGKYGDVIPVAVCSLPNVTPSATLFCEWGKCCDFGKARLAERVIFVTVSQVCSRGFSPWSHVCTSGSLFTTVMSGSPAVTVQCLPRVRITRNFDPTRTALRRVLCVVQCAWSCLMVDAADTWKAKIRTYFAAWWTCVFPNASLAFTLKVKISLLIKECSAFAFIWLVVLPRTHADYIDFAGPEGLDGMRVDIVKPQKIFPSTPLVCLLFPKELVEKVAKLHLPAHNVELTVLTQTQADYAGVKVEDPFTSGHHRQSRNVSWIDLSRRRSLWPTPEWPHRVLCPRHRRTQSRSIVGGSMFSLHMTACVKLRVGEGRSDGLSAGLPDQVLKELRDAVSSLCGYLSPAFLDVVHY